MDRAELSDAIIQELGAVFMAAVQEAMLELLTADLDGIERRLQAVSRQVCGRVVEQVLAVRAGQPRERPPCPACGGLLRLVDRARRRQRQGLVGDATVQRPTYVCTCCGHGHAPLDAELGLGQARGPSRRPWRAWRVGRASQPALRWRSTCWTKRWAWPCPAPRCAA